MPFADSSSCTIVTLGKRLKLQKHLCISSCSSEGQGVVKMQQARIHLKCASDAEHVLWLQRKQTATVLTKRQRIGWMLQHMHLQAVCCVPASTSIPVVQLRPGPPYLRRPRGHSCVSCSMHHGLSSRPHHTACTGTASSCQRFHTLVPFRLGRM